MTTTLIARPLVEPVSLDAAKAICRVDDDLGAEEDGKIAGFIAECRKEAETFMRRPIITTTFELVTDGFRDVLVLDHPRANVQTVKFIDEGGVQRALHPDDIDVDNASDVDSTYIAPAWKKAWPRTRRQMNAVRVRYTAGFGPGEADVPPEIRSWILRHVQMKYESKSPDGLPYTFCALSDYVVVGE